MIRTKICGFTQFEDVALASELGAWALGFVFYSKSPRFVEPKKVGQWTRVLPTNTRKVGVFVDPTDEDLAIALEESGIDTIQLHGSETIDRVESLKTWGVSIIKALRPKAFEEVAFMKQYQRSSSIEACLVDTYSTESFGGTGQTGNWDAAAELSRIRPVILSGGLSDQNVHDALKAVSPYAIDISSSVEDSPGKKNHSKLRRIFHSLENDSEAIQSDRKRSIHL